MNKISIGTPEWKRSFGITKQKRENNSRNFEEIEWGNVHWNHVAQDTD